MIERITVHASILINMEVRVERRIDYALEILSVELVVTATMGIGGLFGGREVPISASDSFDLDQVGRVAPPVSGWLGWVRSTS